MAHGEKPAASQPREELNGASDVRTARAGSMHPAHIHDPALNTASVQSAEIEILGSDLERARTRVIWMLQDAMVRHRVSRRGLALFIAIDESIVRKWLKGRKPIPLAALALLPVDLAREIVDRIFSERMGLVGDSASALIGASKRAEEDLRSNVDPTRRERLLKAMRGTAAALLRATEEP